MVENTGEFISAEDTYTQCLKDRILAILTMIDSKAISKVHENIVCAICANIEYSVCSH